MSIWTTFAFRAAGSLTRELQALPASTRSDFIREALRRALDEPLVKRSAFRPPSMRGTLPSSGLPGGTPSRMGAVAPMF